MQRTLPTVLQYLEPVAGDGIGDWTLEGQTRKAKNEAHHKMSLHISSRVKSPLALCECFRDL
jgi:hypothetical protein